VSGRAGQSPDPLAEPVSQVGEAASNPLVRAFFADDAMTVRVRAKPAEGASPVLDMKAARRNEMKRAQSTLVICNLL
jgi:hypothetical protein